MAQAATRERSQSAAARKKAPDRELKLIRRFAAKPEQVFRAFADPKRLVRWWGPEGYTVPVCEMDVRAAIIPSAASIARSRRRRASYSPGLGTRTACAATRPWLRSR